MSRSPQYEFSSETVQKAFDRQGRRCARCGDGFTNTEWIEKQAHHLTSVEAAKHQGWSAEKTRSVENCAVVHGGSHFEGEKACHWEVHGHGRFGKVDAERSAFPFLNAGEQTQASPSQQSDIKMTSQAETRKTSSNSQAVPEQQPTQSQSNSPKISQ